MKFSENWLREWINPNLTTEVLLERLTLAGLEVEAVEPVAGQFNQVVVGEVLAITPHPDAEKLHVCEVNIGEIEPLTIVCGAANVKVGMKAPTALVGAQLDSHKIKKAKLRGVTSHGMLCSAEELGLAESSDGLFALAEEAPVGQDLRDYLQLEDNSIEISITPNRGDCLGIAGIAREIGVLTKQTVNKPPMMPVADQITDTFPITLENPTACPRYVGRIIKNVNINAPTPLWMQEKLRRSGTRSINAVVDVTNYVLLELGQPMHAFDFNKLQGGIVVRMASKTEKLTLLDEQTVTLDEHVLVIADQQQAQAMAGIMGGLESAVGETTRDIFLESAFFNPDQLAGCARRYGLHTDSAFRFERGVDPQMQRLAIERATALLLAIVGGQPGPVSEIVSEDDLPTAPTITLRSARIYRLLGQSLDATEVTDILTRLGMQVNEQADGWQIIPPTFRFDIHLEADLIEELARIHGYQQIPTCLPHTEAQMTAQPDVRLENLQTALTQRGYQEAITYSFVDPALQTLLTPDLTAIALANPLSQELSVMRTTLWSSLISILQHNQKRQQPRVRLFETGLRFIAQGKDIAQEKMLAGLISGTRWPEQWGLNNQQVDFFDMKADVEAILQLAHLSNVQFSTINHPALHPGQSAAIHHENKYLGVLGALHPRLIESWDLIAPIYVFELQLADLLNPQIPTWREISKYPSIRRDLALVIDENITAQAVLTLVQQTASELLVNYQLFDLYQGKGIESGKKSLAISLIFQAFSRSLTEAEIDEEIKRILYSLEQNLDAQLRK